MKKSVLNTLLLVILTLLISGAGYFYTEVEQPAELAMIEDQHKEAQLRHAEVEQLLKTEAATVEQAELAVRKWNARYKVIPEKIDSPDIIQYLEGFTRGGFEQINTNLKSVNRGKDLSYYTFTVNGTAYFKNLHNFVWHLENNREFYHVRDLKIHHETVTDENPDTGLPRQFDMVDFSMEVDAFFSGAEGLNPPSDELAELPVALLPIRYPAHNSFFPVVRTDLPPNDRNLLDIEEAQLVAIVGNQATFRDETGDHRIRTGDEVYLGHISLIDPAKAIVVATLNKGGVRKVIEIPLTSESSYGTARGGNRLEPIQNN